MRITALLGCLLCLAAAGFPATQKPAKSQTPAKKPAAVSSSKKQPAPKAAASSTKRPTTGKKSKSKKRLPSWRYGQQVPTRERYMEVQQALISRGYLPEPPTGVWGPACVEALKKFQASQHLEPSGKLDSLTLIALGLGPKRAANGSLPKPPPLSELKQP